MKLTRFDSQAVHHSLALSSEELLPLVARSLGIDIPPDAKIDVNTSMGSVTSILVKWSESQSLETNLPVNHGDGPRAA